MFLTNLETDRLLLRNIDKSHRDFIFRQYSNDDVNEFLFDEEPLSDIKGADKIIDFYIKPEPRSQHRWIVVRKSDGKTMGSCGFHCWDNKAGKIEVGYDLKKEFWGNGYMQEAFQEIIRFARENMKIKEIMACIYVENQRSINLVTKFGFVAKGTKNELFRGKEYLHNLYYKNIEE